MVCGVMKRGAGGGGGAGFAAGGGVAGVVVAAGGAAAYVLTRPTKKVVPAVVGENLQDASATIQNAGLNPQVIQVTSGRRAGTVIHQDPQPGVKVNEGSSVTLAGPKGKITPCLIG